MNDINGSEMVRFESLNSSLENSLRIQKMRSFKHLFWPTRLLSVFGHLLTIS